jgi:hypothetical protein
MALKERLTAILGEDLGPSAGIVLSKCTKKSLGKNPADLTPADMPALAEACHRAVRPTLGESVAARIRQNILALQA